MAINQEMPYLEWAAAHHLHSLVITVLPVRWLW